MGETNFKTILCPHCNCEMRANCNCPKCGKRCLALDLFASTQPAQGSITAHKPGPTEALRVGDGPAARSITADLSADGTLTFTLASRRRQNEQGNREVARILMEKLNNDGSRWTTILDPKELARREEGIDCILADDNNNSLNLQITRAYGNPSFWKSINPGAPTTRSVSLNEYVDELRGAIGKKANRLAAKSQVVLALDAIETGHAFLNVTDSFKDRFGDWAHCLGFKAVWLVGPTVDLTRRLDIEGRGSAEAAEGSGGFKDLQT